MRRPWGASAAWEFVTALLASPGVGVLIATQRHADVAREVISELPHLAGNLIDDAHTAILMREHAEAVSTVFTRLKNMVAFADTVSRVKLAIPLVGNAGP